MHHPLYQSLDAIVGSKYVSDEDYVLLAYSRDTSPFPARVPGIVVRPRSTEEVSSIIRVANRTHTPVIPRGAGSTTGGAPAGEPGRSIVVDITRMRDILDINEENMTVTTQCGAPWSKLYFELRKKGLYTPCVWFPGYTGTVGGSLSEAGNPMFHQVHGLYGRHVISVRVVIPSGDVIQTGSAANAYGKAFCRYTHGPDLTGLFIGDHGIFGLKTEATLRLFPSPETRPGAFGFDTAEEAFRAVIGLSRVEPSATAHTFMRSAEAMGEPGEGSWNLVYCVTGYSDGELDLKCRTVEGICKSAGGGEPTEAGRSYAETLPRPWDLCSALAKRGTTLSSDHMMPRDQAPDHFRKVMAWYSRHKGDFEKYRIGRYDWYGFVDNTIIFSPYFAFDDSDVASRGKAVELFRELLDLVVRSGGIFMFADQDVGDVAASAFPPAYYSFLRTLKRAIDPNNIMNPGFFRL